MHAMGAEAITESHRRELHHIAAMSAPTRRRAAKPREALGKALVAWGLRLCMPRPHGARERVREMIDLTA